MFVLWGHKLAPTILTSVKFVFLLDSLILKKILFDEPKHGQVVQLEFRHFMDMALEINIY